MQQQKKLRTKYFILPDFQFKMIGISLGLTLFQLSGLYVLIRQFRSMLREKLMAAGITYDHSLSVFIERQGIQLADYTIYLGLVFLIINFIVFTIITQKIAGPIYQIKKVSADWRNSDAPLDLKLRKNDFFQDLATELQLLNEQFIKKDKKD